MNQDWFVPRLDMIVASGADDGQIILSQAATG